MKMKPNSPLPAGDSWPPAPPLADATGSALHLTLDLIIHRAETLEVSGGHEESIAVRRLAQIVADLALAVKQNKD